MLFFSGVDPAHSLGSAADIRAATPPTRRRTSVTSSSAFVSEDDDGDAFLLQALAALRGDEQRQLVQQRLSTSAGNVIQARSHDNDLGLENRQQRIVLR